MHAHTGCDTTSYPFMKGKTSGFNVLMKHSDLNLECFGEVGATADEIVAAGSKFFSYLYGSHTAVSMSSLRYKVFSGNKSTPPLKNLPPTDAALAQHCLRCHLQVLLWKHAFEEEEPALDITKWGWELKDGVPYPK